MEWKSPCIQWVFAPSLKKINVSSKERKKGRKKERKEKKKEETNKQTKKRET